MANIPLSSLPVKGSYNLSDRVLILNSEDSNDAYTVELDTIKKLPHTHTASEVTDFDTEVSNNPTVESNTAARHTHSNKVILDATQESYTTANKDKLDALTPIIQSDLEAGLNDDHYLTGGVYNDVKGKVALYTWEGGNFTVGAAVVVPLDTQRFDNIGSSLSGNEVTLPVGIYEVKASIGIGASASAQIQYHIRKGVTQVSSTCRVINGSNSTNSGCIVSPVGIVEITSGTDVVSCYITLASGSGLYIDVAQLLITKIS